jgi:hypothetical protein
MQTFSDHKNLLGQWLRKIKEFLTAERSLDWSTSAQKVVGYLTAKSTNQDLHRSRRLGSFLNQIKPLWFAQFIRNTLVLCIVLTLIYAYLAIERLPRVSDAHQSLHIDQLQDVQKAAKLFGHKEFDLSKVQLTGLMRTDGSSSGYAVFEVEGKNTGAIAVGETFDKGYFLKSIGVDSVELMFQGKSHQILMATKRF